jgi:hypothetical protein
MRSHRVRGSSHARWITVVAELLEQVVSRD